MDRLRRGVPRPRRRCLPARERRLIDRLAWADDNIAPLYRDEYYDISLLNNRLLNSERALAQKNARLERALEEIRQANDSIAILERDRITNLYSARGFDRRVGRLLHGGAPARYEVAAIEIDGMRLADEMYGTRTRDRLLRAIAAFLVGLDESGTVALACVDRSTFYALSAAELRFHDVVEKRFPDFANTYPFPVHLCVRIGVCDIDDPPLSGEEARNRAHLALDATISTSRIWSRACATWRSATGFARGTSISRCSNALGRRTRRRHARRFARSGSAASP